MGKLKRERKSYHSAAPKSSDCINSVTNTLVPDVTYSTACNLAFSDPKFKIDLSPGCSNIFKNVSIPSSVLNQKLPCEHKQIDEYDNHGVVSTVSQGKPLTKKARRMLKKEAFLQKLEVGRVSEKKKQDEKKRKATPVVGDMKVLGDALPVLEHLLKKVKHAAPKKIPRAAKSFRTQKREMLQDIETFQQVLKNPYFSSDPVGTISTHLKLLLDSERK